MVIKWNCSLAGATDTQTAGQHRPAFGGFAESSAKPKNQGARRMRRAAPGSGAAQFRPAVPQLPQKQIRGIAFTYPQQTDACGTLAAMPR
jgi:hypothetical protein